MAASLRSIGSAGTAAPPRRSIASRTIAAIVDVAATTAIRQAEILAAKRMIERSMERFDLYPARLIGDSAYGTAEMLNSSRMPALSLNGWSRAACQRSIPMLPLSSTAD